MTKKDLPLFWFTTKLEGPGSSVLVFRYIVQTQLTAPFGGDSSSTVACSDLLFLPLMSHFLFLFPKKSFLPVPLAFFTGRLDFVHLSDLVLHELHVVSPLPVELLLSLWSSESFSTSSFDGPAAAAAPADVLGWGSFERLSDLSLLMSYEVRDNLPKRGPIHVDIP